MILAARKVLFWLHLAVGVTAGTLILFLSITGTLIVFERQMIAWADSKVHVSAAGQRLPLEQVLAAASQAGHGRPSAVTVPSEPGAPVQVTVKKQVWLVDPFSGKVLAESAPRLRPFFETVTGLHRWFGLAGASRQTAKLVKGWFTFGFLFLALSGLILWLPRVWTRVHLRQVVWFRRGHLSGKARDWNWHNVFGLWLALPLAWIALTGVIMALPWANDMVYKLTGSPIPPQRRPGEGGQFERQGAEGQSRGQHAGHGHAHAGMPEEQAPPAGLSLNALLTAAEAQMPNWRTATIRMEPGAEARPLQVQLDSGDGGRPDRKLQVTLDRQQGKLLKKEDFSGNSTGRKLRMWVRFTHTGEAGGLWGEAIAAVASLGACMLVWTGYSLWVRRLFQWWKRKRRQAVEPAAV